ncbi:uncharacterized deoxyribonuclease YMR262W [Monosporozyma servazzii]
MLVDAHCHYDRFECGDVGGGEGVLSLSNSVKWDALDTTAQKEELKQGGKRFRKGLGIHPWYAHLYTLDPHTTKTDHYKQVLKWSGNGRDKIDHFQSEFTLLIQQLPDPVVIQDDTELALPLPHFIGEVGLDKVFRIPLTKGKQKLGDTVALSHFTCSLEHQLVILEWWLRQASKYSLSVQLHAVKYPDPILQSCRKCLASNPNCNILLHGFQGSVENLTQWIRHFTKERVYVSFNTHLNERLLDSYHEVLDSNHVLAETDWPSFHKEQYDMLQTMTTRLQHCYGHSIDFESNIKAFLHQ